MVPDATRGEPREATRDERPRPGGDERRGRDGRSRAAWQGLLGGLVATVVMTAFRLPISGSLPPTAEFWARYVGGGDPDDYPLAALALHLGYGALAGGVFGALVADRLPRTTVARERRGVLLGTAYGLVLSVFGLRVVLGRLLDQHLAPDERFVFHVGHVVYGLTLGAWVGSRAGE